MASTDLIAAIRTRLATAADPVRGAGAQAYMKSTMPSLGVRVPEVRQIVEAAARELPPGSLEELRSTVGELWRGANWREERYAAIDLTGLAPAAGETDMLPIYEEMIRSGAWWDFVDGVSHRLCGLLQADRENMTSVLRRRQRHQPAIAPGSAPQAQPAGPAATRRSWQAGDKSRRRRITGRWVSRWVR